MDYFSIFVKLSFAFVAGIVFWFWEFLVMTVYAYMPGKELRSAVVLTLAPVLYMVLATYLFNRFFKAQGWKDYLKNFGFILLMTGVSLAVLNLLAVLVI